MILQTSVPYLISGRQEQKSFFLKLSEAPLFPLIGKCDYGRRNFYDKEQYQYDNQDT